MAEAEVDDFVELLMSQGQGARGQYDHLGWKLNLGDQNSSSAFALLASLHEAQHHTLNNSTLYGNVLIAFAYLARETQLPRFREILLVLTRNCRQSHEIYATYSSFISLSRVKHVSLEESAFLEHYPMYRTYVTQAKALLPRVESSLVQMLALESVIKICFQNPALLEACLPDLENFSPSQLGSSDYPDARLRTVAESLAPDFWGGVLDDAIAQGSKELGNLIRRAIATDENLFDTLDDAAFEALSTQLIGHFETAVRNLLLRKGQRSLLSGQHLDHLEELLEAARKIAPSEASRSPLVVNRDPESLQDLTSFTRETYHTSDNPLDAQLFSLSELPLAHWLALQHAREQHRYFFIISRLTERLISQYTFSDRDLAILSARHTPFISCLRKRMQVNGSWVVQLYTLDSPEQVVRLKQLSETQLCSNTSMILLAAKEWVSWHRVIAESSRQTVLFDLSPFVHLERTLGSQHEEVSTHKVVISFQGKNHTALVFIASGGKRSSLFLTLCSDLTANAIIYYIRNHLPGSKFTENESLFDRHRLEVRRTLYHLLEEEVAFNFNAIQTGFAQERFKRGGFL